jgi:hypothetical protein
MGDKSDDDPIQVYAAEIDTVAMSLLPAKEILPSI